MIEGNSPGALIDTDVFQKGVKRAVERIDEAGSAVKKTGLEQINAEKAADAVPQPAQNAALAPARAQIRRALFRVGIDFVEMLAEIFVGVVEDVPGDHAVELPEAARTEENSVVLPTVIHCGSTIEVSKYFSEMIAVCWRDTIHRSNRLSCLFDLLLCEICEQESAAAVNTQHFAFVNKIAQFLQSSPEVFYSVSDIARRFYVSEKTLNKRFKTVYGKTFYAWQMEQKLDMVYQALQNNAELTLRETAVNFGFYDEFHLSRAFKKKFGAAPKYVRQRVSV